MVKKQPISRKTKKRYILIAGIVCVVLLIFDTLLVGNIAYYAKWTQCGTQPVVLRHPHRIGFGDSSPVSEAWIRQDFIYIKAPPFGAQDATLHCTLDELKRQHGNALQICETHDPRRIVSNFNVSDLCQQNFDE